MKILLISFCIVCYSIVIGQSKYILRYNSTLKLPFKNIQNNFKDSLELKVYLAKLRIKAIEKGYLLFSIDSLICSPKDAKTNFYVGPKFKKLFLSIDQNQRKFIGNTSAAVEKIIGKNAFTPKNVALILQQIENNLLNKGYPFTSVRLDSIHFQNDDLYAHLHIEENKRITWGEIVIKSNTPINSKLIQSYIQIQSGDLFREEQLQNISKQLNHIPFITETKPLELLFQEDKVDLYLYLATKPVSLITGILGLQPSIKNNTTTYKLTGDIRAKLVNNLKKGESFDLQWKNLQANTQLLKTNISFPSILRSTFGFEGQFQLFKKDSTFLELKSGLAIQYLLSNGNTLKMFYRNYQSSLLSNGQSTAISSNLANVRTNYYGLSLQKQTIDYLPCPTKGYIVQLEGSLGLRSKKDSILQTNTKTTTAKIDFLFNLYYALYKRHILKLVSASEVLVAPSYSRNELVRFGGMANQRGFKEEELRATSRLLISFEYRFLLDQNSFIFLFFDQSWYENKLALTRRDSPYGFGGGLTFGTQLGMFSISYALGKQLTNPILISNGNIHFGYTSYF
jgi:outer membrane protein assembly factor BamA